MNSSGTPKEVSLHTSGLRFNSIALTDQKAQCLI